MANIASHEVMGALFVIDKMQKAIEQIFDDLIEAEYPKIVNNDILYAEHYNNKTVIDKEGFALDIAFIVRMIIGLKYNGFSPEKQIRNCFIELLNSSSFDVDKLDYVIRDTQMSGINNVSVDVERLLGAVCIVTKTKYIDKCFSDEEEFFDTVLTELSGDENSDIKIEGNIIGTLFIQAGATVEIGDKSMLKSLFPEEGAMIRYTSGTDAAEFSPDSIIYADGERVNFHNGSGRIPLDLHIGKFFDCSIRNACVEKKFSFIIQSDDEKKEADSKEGVKKSQKVDGKGIEIKVNGFCKIQIRGRFKSRTAIRCSHTSLFGSVNKLVLIGNRLNKEVPSHKMFNEFSVGFKKQAINVIANLLEARNYLYLWIYAHHKVVYYANFLIPSVSVDALLQIKNKQDALKKCMQEKGVDFSAYESILSEWELDYAHIQYLDDASLWARIKKYYYGGISSGEERKQLCKELLSRKYKISLYKSLAEYDLLFESFSDLQKENMRNNFLNHIRKDLPVVMYGGVIAGGYLDCEVVDALRNKYDLKNIKNIVCVTATYKENRLNTNETFIEMGEDSIVPIIEIPLLAERTAQTNNSAKYFYLYYDTATTGIKEKKAEADKLKEAVKDVAIEMFSEQGKEQIESIEKESVS